MNITTYKLNSFTKNGSGGNPAGVVLNTEALSETDMQVIATKLGFSETAFLLPSDTTDYAIRYFTPVEEVPICGHATLAVFSLLLQKEQIAFGSYIIDTKAGQLTVKVQSDGLIYLQQNEPVFLDTLDSEEIAQTLNAEASIFSPDLPIQIVSTGLKDIIIPVKTLAVLNQLTPDFAKIAEISKKYQVTGYHVFSLETKEDASTAQCRNFAPLFDIPEESATGTSNAALACYLEKYLPADADHTEKERIFEQGYAMGIPSEIRTLTSQKEGHIQTPYVGGRVSDFSKKTLEI